VRPSNIVAPFCLVLAIGAMFGSIARAQPIAPLTIGGIANIESGSTFSRPYDEDCSRAGESVFYSTVQFYVSTDGDYTLQTTDTEVVGHALRPFLALYQSPFDPALISSNCLAADAHGPSEADDDASLTVPLHAGIHYTLVITNERSNDVGPITWLGYGVGDMHYVASATRIGISDPTTSGALLTIQLDHPETAYYVVQQLEPAVPPPTAAQVRAGQNGAGSAPATSGNFAVPLGDTDASMPIKGLDAGTMYTVYVVADHVGNGSDVGSYLFSTSPSVDTASVDNHWLTLARVETSTLLPDPEVCPTGGIRVRSGIDANADGELDRDEIGADEVVCSGANGLINSKPLDPSPDECPTGGVQIESGTDLDGNGVLEGSEVTSSRRACNAVQTLTRSTKIEPTEDDCAFGGVKVDSGLDLNGDETLEDDEVKATVNLCNGSGLAVRTMRLDVGSEDCRSGGAALETGIDTDGDSKLDTSEVIDREVVCKPAQLLFETETLTDYGKVCPHGGQLLKSGLDDGDPGGTPGDGKLQPEEVDLDKALCMAPINVRIGTGCSATSSPRREGGVLGSLVAVSFVMLMRRRRGRARAPR
jgi:hypothetical protein